MKTNSIGLPTKAQQTHANDSFVFVRLVLAIMVVWGHSFPLGGFGEEPISAFCRGQLSPHGLAVKCFFILSGFLLMQALAQRPCFTRYAIRRAFRIMPAFWVCLALTAFVLVPAMIGTMAPERFTYAEKLTGSGEQNAINYFLDNAALYIHQPNVPPVFYRNVFPQALNGSLWSLPYEGLCYLALALAALLGITRSRAAVAAVFALLYLPVLVSTWQPVPFVAGGSEWTVIVNTGLHPRGQGVMLAFAAGMLAHALLRGKIVWNARHFTLCAGVLGVSMLLGGFALLWPLLLPYLLLSLCRRLPFQQVGRVGDFSYGTYLYAFPIQQLLYSFDVHQQGLAIYFGSATLLSVACGVASWFVVERPAMQIGSRLVRFASSARNATCPPVDARPLARAAAS